MNKVNECRISIKKSKFFGYLFKIEKSKEINDVLENVRMHHYKAVHICYGALLQNEEYFKNDGEVGNPGKILLEILKNNNLNNHVLIVARYFGGIKLGPSGVGKAFRDCGNKVAKPSS